jgi:hypothetical protein
MLPEEGHTSPKATSSPKESSQAQTIDFSASPAPVAQEAISFADHEPDNNDIVSFKAGKRPENDKPFNRPKVVSNDPEVKSSTDSKTQAKPQNPTYMSMPSIGSVSGSMPSLGSVSGSMPSLGSVSGSMPTLGSVSGSMPSLGWSKSVKVPGGMKGLNLFSRGRRDYDNLSDNPNGGGRSKFKEEEVDQQFVIEDQEDEEDVIVL